MAQLYLRHVGQVTLGCYSERGLMSFLICRGLPGRLAEFVGHIQFAARCPNPFAHLDGLEDIVLFSELDFGNQGFGKPDGAMFFRSGGCPFFVFFEAKLNQSYRQSCSPGASYNSSIKGQLELKWRAMTLFATPQRGIWEVRGVRYLVENNEMITFYQANDPIYFGVRDLAQLGLDARRRLRLVEGVGTVFDDYIDRCKGNIFYLAATDDEENPLDANVNLRPRCCDIHGQVVEDALNQFCWINKAVCEEWEENPRP